MMSDKFCKYVQIWTCTEYDGFLAGLVRELQCKGYEAKICFNIKAKSYRIAKRPFSRILLRIRQYVIYPLQLLFKLLYLRLTKGSSYLNKEVLIITTNTFFTPLLGTLIHPNVVHLIYDIYPEAMIHANIWKKKSIQTRIVRFIFRYTLNRVKANVFLGLRLKLYAESIYGPIRNPYIIGVGADETLFKYSPKIRSKKEHKSSPLGRSGVEFLYCGNFGRMHDSKTLFHLWRNLENKMIRSESLFTGFNQIYFSFFCSGPKYYELINAVKALPRQISERIFINAGLSLEKWIYVMKTADVALITMAPGAQSVVMPSKTYSAMMAGQAILAIAPEDSDLVDLIKEAECGWWIVPGDYEKLEGVLEKIVNNKGDLNAKKERAYHFAHTHFTQKVLSNKWSHTLQAVISI